MSFYRANVQWQSADATWNLGFFTVLDAEDRDCDPDDVDHEWDAEYDETSFEWVSTGHATENDAWRSWDGANPGSGQLVRYAEDPTACAEYDAMAAAYTARQTASQAGAATVPAAAETTENRFGLMVLRDGQQEAYHATVLWQSADATWNFGFYTKLDPALWHRSPDPATWDDDMDAEFDETTFQWVSTGHATSADAIDAWTGPNPGGFQYARHSAALAAVCAELDTMAAACPQRHPAPALAEPRA